MSIASVTRQGARSIKNYTMGYSPSQIKVRAATCVDDWGPSGTQMNEIAQLTHNQQDFVEIIEMIEKRLDDKGKFWRHVFKSLTLVDYLLHLGSENVVFYFIENKHVIATLREFQYIDENGQDKGANIRQKAKDITNLLDDPARLKEGRRSRANMHARMSGRPEDPGDAVTTSPRTPRSNPNPSRNSNNREDDELQRALELSRQSALAEAEKNKVQVTDKEMEEAMRLSREEEEKRKRDQENANALFDDGFDQHNNNQLQLVDTSVPYQQTGMMPQFSSFNPYLAAQQEAEYLQQQQALEAQRQQMEQQAQYEQMMQQAAYMQQQQQQQLMPQMTAMPLQPQMTSFGSNNPFANFGQQQPPQQQHHMPSASPAPRAPSAPPSSFNFGDYGSLSSSSSSSFARPSVSVTSLTPPPMPTQTTSNAEAFKRPMKKDDGQHTKLANLLAQGGGVDTFGNEGALRVPAGSPFHPSNRVASQQTGTTNPFGQMTSSSSSTSSLGNQQVNGFGNHFGGPPFQQQQQHQQQQQQQQQQDSPFFTL